MISSTPSLKSIAPFWAKSTHSHRLPVFSTWMLQMCDQFISSQRTSTTLIHTNLNIEPTSKSNLFSHYITYVLFEGRLGFVVLLWRWVGWMRERDGYICMLNSMVLVCEWEKEKERNTWYICMLNGMVLVYEWEREKDGYICMLNGMVLVCEWEKEREREMHGINACMHAFLACSLDRWHGMVGYGMGMRGASWVVAWVVARGHESGVGGWCPLAREGAGGTSTTFLCAIIRGANTQVSGPVRNKISKVDRSIGISDSATLQRFGGNKKTVSSGIRRGGGFCPASPPNRFRLLLIFEDRSLFLASCPELAFVGLVLFCLSYCQVPRNPFVLLPSEQCLGRDIRRRRSALVPTAGMLAAAPVAPCCELLFCRWCCCIIIIILVAAPAPGWSPTSKDILGLDFAPSRHLCTCCVHFPIHPATQFAHAPHVLVLLNLS